MIIIKMMGGLGNQMFQYAFYQKLLQIGKNVKLDLTSYSNDNSREFELDKFQMVKFEECSKRERSKFVDDSKFIFSRLRRKLLGNKTNIIRESSPFDASYFSLDSAYLLGYWTCEKYYEDMVDVLRSHFVFPTIHNEASIHLADEISNNSESVSVHIRRGDYLSNRHKERFGNICTENYYTIAMNFMRESLNSPHFYIFSDDPEFVRKNYQSDDITIVDWNQNDSGIYDLQLMSLCSHNICANSTFSKWAAILNINDEKIRVMPFKHTNDEEYTIDEMKEWWKNWLMIKDDSEIISSYYDKDFLVRRNNEYI